MDAILLCLLNSINSPLQKKTTAVLKRKSPRRQLALGHPKICFQRNRHKIPSLPVLQQYQSRAFQCFLQAAAQIAVSPRAEQNFVLHLRRQLLHNHRHDILYLPGVQSLPANLLLQQIIAEALDSRMIKLPHIHSFHLIELPLLQAQTVGEKIIIRTQPVFFQRRHTQPQRLPVNLRTVQRARRQLFLMLQAVAYAVEQRRGMLYKPIVQLRPDLLRLLALRFAQMSSQKPHGFSRMVQIGQHLLPLCRRPLHSFLLQQRIQPAQPVHNA